MAKKSKKVDIILLQNVANLWNKWTLLQVSPAYAKNSLIPKWYAKLADSTDVNSIKQKESKKEKEKQDEINKYKEMIEDLKWKSFIIQRSAGPNWKLYEKVDSKLISLEILKAYKVKLEASNIKLDWKIEETWKYEVQISNWKNKNKINIEIKAK